MPFNSCLLDAGIERWISCKLSQCVYVWKLRFKHSYGCFLLAPVGYAECHSTYHKHASPKRKIPFKCSLFLQLPNDYGLIQSSAQQLYQCQLIELWHKCHGFRQHSWQLLNDGYLWTLILLFLIFHNSGLYVITTWTSLATSRACSCTWLDLFYSLHSWES